jgi:23S rRNA (adenine2503-C2)-methyltransferase
VSVAIQGQLPETISEELGCPVGEVRRVLARVHQRDLTDLSSPLPQVSKRTRGLLAERFHVGRLEIAEAQTSKLDPFVKFALRADDGHFIETVRIPLEREGRFSVCVSSQVGCIMGCTFCKTAQSGFVRNLEAWEIVEQVRIARQSLPAHSRVSGVVFQGMGEPLANIDAVILAVQILSHPSCQSIDQKAMTISTCGLPRGIERLKDAKLRVRIGVSLGHVLSQTRKSLMPIEKRFPLSETLDALVDYTLASGQCPMLSYTLLSGINCGPDDADALRQVVLDVGRRAERMPRLSLIPYNPIGPADPFKRATEEEAETFRLRLISAGFPVVRRYSGGGDIDAACGQLAARRSTEPLTPAHS